MIKLIKQTEIYKNIEFEVNSFQLMFRTGKKAPTQFRGKVKAILDVSSDRQQIDISDFALKNLKLRKNDNVFYNYFKDYENLQGMSFEQKVNFATENFINCLININNFTAKLQRDFLSDFSEFLEVENFKSKFDNADRLDENIFSCSEYFQRFKTVLQNNSYVDENDNLSIKKTFLAGIIAMLKENGIIKNVTDVKIAQYMVDFFNYTISTSTLSNGTPYATKDEENKLFKDLYDEFMIDH